MVVNAFIVDGAEINPTHAIVHYVFSALFKAHAWLPFQLFFPMLDYVIFFSSFSFFFSLKDIRMCCVLPCDKPVGADTAGHKG